MELNQEPNLEISIKELSHIFPFFILFSHQLKLEFYGKSIYHLYPNLHKNDDFFTHWEIIRPWVETCNAETIETLTGKLVVICNRSKPSLKFKGQFERIKLENKYIFIGSPWFNDSDQLIENNLSIGDFAFHDSTIDLLHVLKNNEIANFELREILQRINDQKQLLLKEQTTLLNKERMLQGLSESTEILISNNTDSLLLEDAFSKIGESLDIHKIVLFKSEAEYATSFKAWSFESSMHKSFSIVHPNQTELKKNTTLEITNTINSRANEFSTYLEEQKANSVLTIPLFIKNAFWGYIEFIDMRKERNWSTDEKRILKIFSNCIASTIENRENAAEIYNMALFPLENTDPVIRIDKNGNVLLRNKASEKLNYLVVANKKRSETVLFKYLANSLKKENREIIFEGKFDQLYYQANARLTNNNQNINIYLTNITKQKETEKLISLSNEKLKLFQLLINNSSDGLQVSFESGQLIYINEITSKRLGIPMDECQKFNVKDFEKTFQKEFSWENHVEDLKMTDSITIEGEHINLSDGNSFPAEVTVKHITISGIGYIVAHTRDITERKKNEQQFQIQEKKYKNIISSMNLGLLEVDLNETIQYCNKNFSEISGFESSELIGKNAATLFYNHNENKTLTQKTNYRKKGLYESYEAFVKNKENEDRWWFISSAPNYNENGEIIGEIGIHLDITKQKSLEKELEKALSLSEGVSKAKEAFLINMSHEIRTPLNGIIGMIRELDKEEKTAQQKSYIDSAKTASKHLLSMVNNILDLSKIEAGELILNEEEINFHSIIKDIQKIVSNDTKEKGLKLEVKISPQINKSLSGDKTRIQQIILNILNNAIKFTAKGFVKIECDLLKSENEKQTIRVKITDSGIGMKNEYIPKLFTKFQQEDSSTSRMYGGTGLGMVITKQLIDLLHGEISVKSQKNIGTEITLELPFNVFKGESILPLKNKQNFKSLKNLKILIVEDNEMNRMVAKNALALFAPKITEAENGKEAISILKRESFDIVLMDLQMPIMGGIEATKIIRNELKISTPIIALSANAFKTEIEKCLANGMSSYVTKPFEEKDLIDAICKEMGATYTSKTEDKKSVFTKKSTLYSTENLMNVSGNDVEFILKMLKLFIQITPDLIVKLEDAFQNKDISTIQKTAHYIKPTIDNLEINTLKEDIRALESLNENFNENKNLAALIEKTTKTLALVVQEMNENEFN